MGLDVGLVGRLDGLAEEGLEVVPLISLSNIIISTKKNFRVRLVIISPNVEKNIPRKHTLRSGRHESLTVCHNRSKYDHNANHQKCDSGREKRF